MRGLIFENSGIAPASPPVDQSGTFVDWTTEETPPTEVVANGYAGRNFTGGGYAVPSLNRYLGVNGICLRLLFLPGDTETEHSLLARGRGGPAALEYWSWDLRCRRDGLLLRFALSWQDAAGLPVSHELGSVPFESRLFFVAVAREHPINSPALIRLYVDGVRVSEMTTAVPVVAASNVPITIGGRFNGSSFEAAAVDGPSIFRIELLDRASQDTEEQDRHRALMEWPMAALNSIRSDWFELGPSYERYRLQPMAELAATMLGDMDREGNQTPATAYGDGLVQWEDALGLEPVGSLSGRLQAVQAALADVGGFQRERIVGLVASLLNVDPESIDLVEGTTTYDRYFAPGPVTPEPPPGCFAVAGNGAVSRKEDGLFLEATGPHTYSSAGQGDLLRAFLGIRGLTEDMQYYQESRIYDSGFTITYYTAGLALVGTAPSATLFVRIGTAIIDSVAVDTIEAGQWDGSAFQWQQLAVSAPVVLGPPPLPEDVGLLTKDMRLARTGTTWTAGIRGPLSWDGTPGEWTFAEIPGNLLPPDPSWIGPCIANDVVVTALTAVISRIALHTPLLSPAWWAAYSSDPIVGIDLQRANRLLSARNRATVAGTMTDALVLLCDTAGQLDYTPTES